MIEIALMVEGQDGLNWDHWRAIARTAEDAGFVGLYRSDHFTNPSGPPKDSLECWVSLAWLAGHTSRLEFGPLVSPVSVRHPAMLVRQAAAVADLSGGRLRLGIGAGWQAREHASYGYHLGRVPERMARFREGVQIMAHLLRSDTPLTFAGEHYALREAVLLPRPEHRVPLVLGGTGRRVMLPLVARYADEWNCGPRSPEEFRELNTHLDELIDQAGRPRSSVRRSMMVFIREDAALRSDEQIREHVAALEAAGVQRVMLNWRDDYADTAGMAALARALI